MLIFGIDPGVSGAISILENKKVIEVFDMPTMIDGKKNKRQVNGSQVTNIIKENLYNNKETIVVVEQVSAMPGQGVTGLLNFFLQNSYQFLNLRIRVEYHHHLLESVKNSILLWFFLDLAKFCL